MKHYLTNNAQMYVTIAFGLICITPVMNSPHYYQRKQVSVFSRHVRPHKMDFEYEGTKGGNECPETEPWPCRTQGQCLAFDFICNNHKDCDDGFDELPALCTAKQRPPKVYLQQFIAKFRDYLIPDVFGDRRSEEFIAAYLTEAKNIKDFAEKLELNEDQYQNLYDMMQSAKYGRSIDIELMGFPLRMWPYVEFLFGRIARSGFIDDS